MQYILNKLTAIFNSFSFLLNQECLILLIVILIVVIAYISFQLSKEKKSRIEVELHLVEMEKMLGEFRTIRHQYNNIFQSIIFTIENEQWDMIRDLKNEILHNTSAINKSDKLQALKIKKYKIRSLILKIADACKESEVSFSITVSEDINQINMDELELYRVIRFLFDDSLDEVKRSSKKEIIIQATSYSKGVSIVLYSTFGVRPEIGKIFTEEPQKCDSNRKTEADAVKKILKKNKNVIFNDYIEDDYYVQELMIMQG